MNKIHVTLAKVKIKNKTLKIGFFEQITKIAEIILILEKKINKIELTIIFYFFLTPNRLLFVFLPTTAKKSYLPRIAA